jgi:polyhydroxyalkanoate synthesis regulator phasin
MDADDLRAQVEQAQKLARECVVFLDLEDQQRLTASFAASHSDYLIKQTEELQRQIGDKQSKPEITSVLSEYRARLDELSQQTSRLPSSPDRHQLEQLERKFGQLESRF